MTRQDAAEQYARAMRNLICANVAAMRALAPSKLLAREAAEAERDLAAAILVLTDPADAIRQFLDAPLAGSPAPPSNLCFQCRAAYAESTWEAHIATDQHQRASAAGGGRG